MGGQQNNRNWFNRLTIKFYFANYFLFKEEDAASASGPQPVLIGKVGEMSTNVRTLASQLPNHRL